MNGFGLVFAFRVHIYISFFIMTKASPLSTVRTIQLSSFQSLCKAFLSSLVMLEDMSLGFGCEFCEDILDIGKVFNTVRFFQRGCFLQLNHRHVWWH